jgi:hypothetical protein
VSIVESSGFFLPEAFSALKAQLCFRAKTGFKSYHFVYLRAKICPKHWQIMTKNRAVYAQKIIPRLFFMIIANYFRQKFWPQHSSQLTFVKLTCKNE